MAEPGSIQPAASAIDVDITARLLARPGMGVLSHHPDSQVIGDAVIDAHTDSAGREIVALCIPIAVHIDKVTESSHPHAPAVFRPGLENRFHDSFRGFSVHGSFVL